MFDGNVYNVDILHCQSNEVVYRTIDRFSKEEIKDAYTHDPWLRNYYLNIWEYVMGQDVLESYPWNVALPLADLCNARCTFCDAWLRGEGVMQPEDLERFVEVLRYARIIGIQGHGEPLANPHIDTILSRVSEVIDGRARAYIISNGVFLEKKMELLLRSRVKVYNISLNAASNVTHNLVMGLGEQAYTTVLSAIHRLIEIKNSTDPSIEVTISMVLTRDNIEEASDFVRLGNKLGVDRIYLRTLMPISPPNKASTWNEAGWETAVVMPSGLNYHLLPPYLHPNFSSLVEKLRDEILSSIVPVDAHPDSWAKPVISEQVLKVLDKKKPRFIERKEALTDKSIHMAYKSAKKEVIGRGEFFEDVLDDGPNPYGRTSRFHCRFVYHNLNCNEVNYRIVPCCYMSEVPGYRSVVFGSSGKFMDYWNAPAFVKLRQRLRDGPLFSACKTCPNQG